MNENPYNVNPFEVKYLTPTKSGKCYYLDEAIFEVLTEDLEEKVEPKPEMKGRTRKFYTFV